MHKKQSIIMVLAAIIAAFAGLWMGQSTQVEIKPEPIQGAIYPQAKKLNDFDLTDHQSKTFTKENLKNQWSLIFVGYTHCPDVCPTTMAVMNQVNELMTQQKVNVPKIVFLSIDPERDTAEILKPYVAYFNKDFIGLTGTLEQVSQVSQQLNAVFRKSAGASGNITAEDYLMDHSSALMLINPNGNLQSILTAPHTPGNIIESIIKSQAYFDILNN